MKRFSKSYTCWPVDGSEHLNITLVESRGVDLEDLEINAELYLEDWHGNEGPAWSLGDLPKKDYEAILEDFREFLAGPDADELAYERSIEEYYEGSSPSISEQLQQAKKLK